MSPGTRGYLQDDAWGAADQLHAVTWMDTGGQGRTEDGGSCGVTPGGVRGAFHCRRWETEGAGGPRTGMSKGPMPGTGELSEMPCLVAIKSW